MRVKKTIASHLNFTSETLRLDFEGTDDMRLEEMVAFDRVTDLASFANLLKPGQLIFIKQREI